MEDEIKTRFWSKVDKGVCWLWQGSSDRGGYGRFKLKRKMRKAHRVAWELTYGPIPAGMCVLHRCDVPACVYPAHLWIGTVAENNADCRIKGRAAINFGKGNAKLTESQVREIKSLLATRTIKEISKLYGRGYSTIGHISSGENWSHVSIT